jgi:Prenyltransferase and squalene oxidase repeat
MKYASRMAMTAVALSVAGSAVAFADTTAAAPASTSLLKQDAAAAAKWMSKNGKNHEWKLVSLYAESGALQASSWTADELSKLKTSTDYARFILGLLAAGQDPHNYHGKNYVSALAATQLKSGDNEGKFADNIDGTGTDGVNAQIWAIIALEDAGGAKYNRASAAAWLLAHQNKDGGFGWSASSTDSDADDTAAAVDALALLGYTKDSKAVSAALAYLKTQQNADGGFGSGGASNSDSTAVVIDGLEALGVNPDSWAQKDGTPSAALTAFYDKSTGGFMYDKSGQSWSGVNESSTKDALLGMSALLTHKSVYQRLHWHSFHWLNDYWTHVYEQGGAWANGHFASWNELRPMAIAGSYVSDLTPAWQAVVKAHGKYVTKGGKKVWEAWDPTLASQALRDSFGADTMHLNGLA